MLAVTIWLVKRVRLGLVTRPRAPSLVRLAPKSKSLAQYGKNATGYRYYLSAARRGNKGRVKCHEMFESKLQSWHRPRIPSARLV